MLAACLKQENGGEDCKIAIDHLESLKSLYHGPVESPERELELARNVVNHRVRRPKAAETKDPGTIASVLDPLHKKKFTFREYLTHIFANHFERVKNNIEVAALDPLIRRTLFFWGAIIVFIIAFIAAYFAYKALAAVADKYSYHYQSEAYTDRFRQKQENGF
jgi:hypothetical protein